MSLYQYRGTQTIEAEQERQEQLKAELAVERERLKEAMRVRRENDRLEAEILRVQQRARELAKPATTTPPPRYGGLEGLRAAAEEAAQHERRKRHELAA